MASACTPRTPEDNRYEVSKSLTINRIKNMIRIVKHPIEEESLFAKQNVPCIPYYTVGLYGKQEELLRRHMAERLFFGAFESKLNPKQQLTGLLGNHTPMPIELHSWFNGREARMTLQEVEYLQSWCNVISMQPPLRDLGLYGATFYMNGHKYEGRLTADWLRTILGFDPYRHKMNFGK